MLKKFKWDKWQRLIGLTRGDTEMSQPIDFLKKKKRAKNRRENGIYSWEIGLLTYNRVICLRVYPARYTNLIQNRLEVW